jgi:O-antigen/teichoic acid export membrane protein
MGKAKLSFYITSIMLVVNVLITYLMVLNYSIVGAASAIVIMYTLSSLFGYVALKIILRDLKND